MKEKDEGDWKFQYSWKIGQDMFNLRAQSMDEFIVHISHMEEHLDILRKLPSFFATQQSFPIGDVRATPPPEVPVAAAPQGAATAGVEIGPIVVAKMEEQQGIGKPKIDPRTGLEKPGRPYTKHNITFGSGVKASTFDSLIADIARQMIGKAVYARIEKTQYGNDLVSIRPAA